MHYPLCSIQSILWVGKGKVTELNLLRPCPVPSRDSSRISGATFGVCQHSRGQVAVVGVFGLSLHCNSSKV